MAAKRVKRRWRTLGDAEIVSELGLLVADRPCTCALWIQ